MYSDFIIMDAAAYLVGLGSEALMNIHGHGVKLLERLDRLEQNHDDAPTFHGLDRASCKQ